VRLGGLQLRSLDLLGAASQVTLELSRPAGAAYLYLAGGICRVAIRRPSGVGVRLVAQDGVSHLVFDGQWFRSLGRDTRLEPDFNRLRRYDQPDRRRPVMCQSKEFLRPADMLN
jgi:hypothetical protein